MLRTLWVVLLCASTAARAAEPSFAVAPGLVKIRPTQPLPLEASASSSIDVTAARGSCEGVQVIATAGAEALTGLTATASDLKGPGHPLPVLLYREAFVDVATPSDAEGATGLWPDPLIPTIDPIAHEPRNAFPVDVPAGQHQPVYAEVCVPAATTPGQYRGTITLRGDKGVRATTTLSVSVRNVTLPASSSIPVTFGISGKSLQFGHFGEKRADAERLPLTRRYAFEALRHRISLHGMTMLQPSVDAATGQPDFTEWDAEIGPFMDGRVGLDGARFSATDLRTPGGLTGPALETYYRAVQDHFRAKGWLDRLFAYVMDEPAPRQFPELQERLAALSATPGIQRLVTMSLSPQFVGHVDIWTPTINCLDYKEKPTEFCAEFAPRRAYDARLAAGDRLWWYQSCNSHGCGSGPFGDRRDDYFTGWPSYMIDIDGGGARIMGVEEFARNVGGELYFDTVYAYNRYAKNRPEREDPWDTVWAFGGNGDGTLFYPGRPDKIGGSTDIPIDSLRLKHIRDGRQDYELLHLLDSRGAEGHRRAQSLAAAMAPHIYGAHRTVAAFDDLRAALFDALDPPGDTPRGARPAGRPLP